MKIVNENLLSKIWLITGGSGSFGQSATKYILDNLSPIAVRVYSRGEVKQYEMAQKFHDDRLRFLIGDVRDKDRLYRAIDGVDFCLNAAALKQIPTAEYNPAETVKTNIIGSMNVIDACLNNGVERVIGISSDKAVAPCNLYGATKMVMEKLFIQANVYAGKKSTKFSCTRYGNVLGSRGSVIPLFQKQKETGEITITDERMTRFWLTVEQGVRFVINCLGRMHGGEIFVPKLPSMRLVDMADVIAPDAKKKFIGLRPGEKLHEVLIVEEESHHTWEFDDYFIVYPEFSFRRESKIQVGKALTENTRYASDNNTWWLTKEELREMIEGL